jgi:hypothetical protein
MPLYKYFTLEEYKKASHPLPLPPEVEIEAHRILSIVDYIRGIWGEPLFILSGGAWRGKDFNRKIGGKPASRHMVGDALDIRPKDCSEEKIIKLCELIENEIKGERLPIKGIGCGLGKYIRGEASFLHIDARTRRARWEENAKREINNDKEDKE